MTPYVCTIGQEISYPSKVAHPVYLTATVDVDRPNRVKAQVPLLPASKGLVDVLLDLESRDGQLMMNVQVLQHGFAFVKAAQGTPSLYITTGAFSDPYTVEINCNQEKK